MFPKNYLMKYNDARIMSDTMIKNTCVYYKLLF